MYPCRPSCPVRLHPIARLADHPGHHPALGTPPRTVAPAANRRRLGLLTVAVLVPTAAIFAGAHGAWPLLAIAVVLAVPLAGVPGFVGTVAAAGCVMAVASGQPDVDGIPMAIGLAAFALAGIAVGVLHAAQADEAARAAEVSFSDRLTALGSEDYFLDALERECARAARQGTPLSVAVLDLDRFEDFNRRFGTPVGNHFLVSVGEVIRAVARRSDMAARIEGGQYAVLVPGPPEEAVSVADRILTGVAGLRVPASRGREAGTTMSAGIATAEPGDDVAGTALLDRAERALDDAKAGGRNRITVFSPELRWASSTAA